MVTSAEAKIETKPAETKTAASGKPFVIAACEVAGVNPDSIASFVRRGGSADITYFGGPGGAIGHIFVTEQQMTNLAIQKALAKHGLTLRQVSAVDMAPGSCTIHVKGKKDTITVEM